MVKVLQGGAGHPAPAHRALGEHRGVRVVPVRIEQGFGVISGGRQHLVAAGQVECIRQPRAHWVIGLFEQHAHFSFGPGRFGDHAQHGRQGIGRGIDRGQPTATVMDKCFQFPVGGPCRSSPA